MSHQHLASIVFCFVLFCFCKAAAKFYWK
jgi:hypothetical protein